MNEEANHEVYGKGTTAADILEGKTNMPRGLEPLYMQLSQLVNGS